MKMTDRKTIIKDIVHKLVMGTPQTIDEIMGYIRGEIDICEMLKSESYEYNEGKSEAYTDVLCLLIDWKVKNDI